MALTPPLPALPTTQEREQKELSDATRAWIMYFTDQLRQGFTGEFRFQCYEGGIRGATAEVEIRTPEPRKKHRS